MAAKRTAARGATRAVSTFTEAERAAMKERARESRARAHATREEGEADVLSKIAEMPPADRALGERIHRLITATAPDLSPRTWYGMPAYAKDGQVVCFFRPSSKFKNRYSTLGFSDEASLDEGHMWPTDFALTELTAVDEARIVALVKRALG